MSEGFTRTNYSNGYIVDFDDSPCDSWILLPGGTLWADWLRAFLYALALAYCFLGIAIAADIFMAAIEVITSKEKKIIKRTPDGGTETITVLVWNPTVANLTLMALGSSAPEILLAVIETVTGLGEPAGELGPGTIVGSAAFNLLVITAISILAVPKGQTRKIDEFGVFVITCVFSFLAYIWMFIVLAVWTPDEVTLVEALITLLLFPVLITLSWLQDVNWFRKRKEGEEDTEKPNFHVLELEVETSGPDLEANKKEIKAMRKQLRQSQYGADDGKEQTKDQEAAEIAKRIALQTDDWEHVSKMMYRMNAVRGITGRKRAIPKHTLATAHQDSRGHWVSEMELQVVDEVKKEGKGVFAFAAASYSVLESKGKIEIKVVRSGATEGTCSVDYYTKDGTATSGSDYTETKGTLVFENAQVSGIITIPIVDDDEPEDDETFELILHNPSPGCDILEGHSKTVITIVDDEEKSVISFATPTARIIEGGGQIELLVKRDNGTNGVATVDYFTKEGTAASGIKYVETKGTLTFEHGEAAKTISVPIIDNDIKEDDETFFVVLANPSSGVVLGKPKKCEVTIEDDDDLNTVVGKVSDLMKKRVETFRLTTSSWKEQFEDALTLSGDSNELGEPLPPSLFDMIMHILSLPWKLLFAFIPPTHYGGGWVAFSVALVFIGIVTAIVGELASLFGCIVGLKDSVTAISFVALGTSLPDTFASKQAAVESSNADSSIGNVTGSNSVNVFLGLGLPWTIAAIYYVAKGETYVVPAGDLGFSVAIFLACATMAVILLMARRYIKAFGAELGGHVTLKYISAAFLTFLWMIYLLLSALRAYEVL